MRKEESFTLAGRTLVAKELTGPEADRVFTALDSGYDLTPLDLLVLPTRHLPEFVVNLSLGIDLGELVRGEELAPSEFIAAYDKVAEVNPFLAKSLALFNAATRGTRPTPDG